MARYIDANALKEKAWDADTRRGYVQVVDVADIDAIPTADVTEVVHACWKGPFAGRAICSACGEDQDVEMFVGNPVQKYCARCGARMDGGATAQEGTEQ